MVYTAKTEANPLPLTSFLLGKEKASYSTSLSRWVFFTVKMQ